MSETETTTRDLNDFAAITIGANDNLICGRGRFTAAELIALAAEQLALNHAKTLCDAVVKNFNTGDAVAGRCAISPTTKRLYVYCADNLWHALIPTSSDGIQMPTIEEEGVKNVL